MVDDLLKTRLLEGKTFQEVGQLLGSPNSQISVDELYEKWAAVRDATVLRKDFGSPGPGWPHEYMYNVGYMGFDREFPMVLSYDLYVKFRDGQVSKAYVHD
jgi:hypothetical protein